MIDEKEYRGYWWIPENSEHTVGGVAKFTPDDGVSLELFSPLNEDPEYIDSRTVLKYDYIHGHTINDEQITLKDCTRSSYSLSFGGGRSASKSAYRASRLTTGGLFSGEIGF